MRAELSERRVTLKGVQAELRKLGLVVVSRPEFGEFEVRQKGIVGGGYFTTDLEDARDTGLAMALLLAARPDAARIASLRAQAARLERDARALLLDRGQVLNPHNRRAAGEMREMAQAMRAQADRLDAKGSAA
jgi:hypothetical protein